MADLEDKVPESTEGAYYVTSDCIGCGVCLDTAPDHFKMNADESNAYVCKQPDTDEEKSACEDALSDCPADAIGNNG